MKLIFFILVLIATGTSLPAQDRKPGQKPANTKPLTIRSTMPKAGTNPPATTPPPTQSAPVQQPTGDLPDLHITALTVTATGTSPGIFTLEINYKIRNDGKVAVPLANVNIQGYIATEANMNVTLPSPLYAAGCGVAGGVGEDVLEPGKEKTGTFRCSDRVLSIPAKPVYQLTVNKPALFQELTLSNNTEITYILF